MAITPTKTKKQLKTVFAGLSSIMLQKTPITLTTSQSSTTISSIAPDFDLPVKVDTLSLTQGAPSINHYKVHGQASDWCSTATPQDAEIAMTIPSVAEDLLQYFFGNAGSVTYTSGTGESAESWSGKGVVNDAVKVVCSLVLLSDTGKDMFIIRNAALWASLQYENASTEPIAILISGTIEGDDETADYIYLHKS